MTPEQIQDAADRAEGKKPGKAERTGRPSKYQPSFAEQAGKLCALGATDVEMADFFGVATSTVYLWKNTHPEFSEALKAAKENADNRVERSLYQRALGYSHEAVKIIAVGGEVQQVPYREHYAPDTTAAIFWLKNRRPDDWRDRREMEHTGKDGGPIQTEDATDPRELARAVAMLLAEGAQGD